MILDPLVAFALSVVRAVLRRDVELPGVECRITVDGVRGKCPAGLRAGDAARYNLWDRSVLCPASLHNMFLFLPEKGDKNTTRLRIACPDPGGAEYLVDSVMKDVCGSRNGAAGVLPGGAPPAGFCSLAFHSISPYLRVLREGGSFGWLRPGAPVRVRCPSAEGIVMEAGSAAGGRVFVRIAALNGDCPAGMRQGAVFRKFSAPGPGAMGAGGPGRCP